MLVEVGSDARPGDGALIHADIEPVRSRSGLQRGDGRLREGGELDRLALGEVDIEGHVAVGAHEDVPGVVGEEVHDDEALHAPVDDQPVLVGPIRAGAEGAALAAVLGRAFASDIGHPVRGPQSLEPVRGPGELARRLHQDLLGERCPDVRLSHVSILRARGGWATGAACA